MAVPSSWGDLSSDGKGKIGIWTSLSLTDTTATLNTEVWIWTKYSVDDPNHTLKYNGTSVTSSAIKTTHESGAGFDKSNQQKIYSTSHTYDRELSDQSVTITAELSGINVINGTMKASATITIPAPNTIAHWAWGFKNGEGNNGNKAAFKLTDTTFTKNYGDKFVLNNDNITTIPNGFYVEQDFVTPSIGDGATWVEYPFGTNVTQKASSMHFEYDYQPYYYNIAYNLNGGLNHADNPATYNTLYGVSLKTPTKNFYTFLGWEIETEEQNINLSAGSDENYKYVRILNNIQPGIEYQITADSVMLKYGSTTQFTIKIYDFTSLCPLASNRYINLGENINISLTCPETADKTHEIAILMYAGVVGATANQSIAVTNMRIKYNFATGINEGDNATFSSPDDLYAKLNARMTGNVTAKAIYEPYKYTITFNGNGGTTTIDSLEIAYETTQNNDVSQLIPKRQAYEFLGWYSSPTGGVQVYDANGLCTNDGTYWINDMCVYTEDYTLYAQWKPLNIAYYNKNGEWKLCRTYIKLNNIWNPAIMYIKSDNVYIR